MRELNKIEQSQIWGGDASLMPIQYKNGDGTAVAESRSPTAHEQSIISSFSPTNPFSNTTQGKMQENYTDGLQEFWGHSAVDNNYIITEEYLPNGSPGAMVVSGGADSNYFLYEEFTPGMLEWQQQNPALAPNGISDPQHNWSATVEGQPAQDVWFGDSTESGGDGTDYGDGGIDNGKWS